MPPCEEQRYDLILQLSWRLNERQTTTARKKDLDEEDDKKYDQEGEG